MFLGIESSTNVASIALVDEKKVIGEITYNVAKSHSGELLTMVDSVLQIGGIKLKELTGISVGVGPGSFTGLRIGISLGVSLSYGSGVPIVGVSSLEGLSYNGKGYGAMCASLIYGRKNEAYALVKKGEEILVEEGTYQLEALFDKLPKEDIILLGDGHLYQKAFANAGFQVLSVNERATLASGSSIAYLGMKKYKEQGEDDPFEIHPNYLRKAEAEINLEKSRNKK